LEGLGWRAGVNMARATSMIKQAFEYDKIWLGHKRRVLKQD
jgi:hypothetical protein